MKTIAVLVTLLVLIVSISGIVQAKNINKEDMLYQRWASLIYPSPTRLKNFCSNDRINAVSYLERTCRLDDGKCRDFLADRWQQYCRYTSTGGIRDYNYLIVFKEIRDEMNERDLRFLRHRRDEIVTMAMPIVEDNLVIPEQPIGGKSGSQSMPKRRMVAA